MCKKGRFFDHSNRGRFVVFALPKNLRPPNDAAQCAGSSGASRMAIAAMANVTSVSPLAWHFSLEYLLLIHLLSKCSYSSRRGNCNPCRRHLWRYHSGRYIGRDQQSVCSRLAQPTSTDQCIPPPTFGQGNPNTIAKDEFQEALEG